MSAHSISSTGNIYCIGRNYQDHALELGNPVPKSPLVFLKNTACLQSIFDSQVSWQDAPIHYECEMVFQLGRDIPVGQKGSWEDLSHLALGLDLTKRHVQDRAKKEGLPWTAAKCFAGSALVTPRIAISSLKASDFTFEFYLNHELKQKGHLEQMIFDLPTLLTHLSQTLPLFAGDLIFTGTPSGVGEIRQGDHVRLSLPTLGEEWTAMIN